MRRVFALRLDVNLLLLIWPTIEMRREFMTARPEVDLKWGVTSGFSVDKNFSTGRLARDVGGGADKRERLARRFSARDFHFVPHFPVAAPRDNRIFPSRKIDNRLRCCPIARDLTVFAPNRKLRAGRIRLNFQRSPASHEMKRRRIKRPFAAKIDRCLDRIVTGTHDGQVVFA